MYQVEAFQRLERVWRESKTLKKIPELLRFPPKDWRVWRVYNLIKPCKAEGY
jgi:hypothetical protein